MMRSITDKFFVCTITLAKYKGKRLNIHNYIYYYFAVLDAIKRI